MCELSLYWFKSIFECLLSIPGRFCADVKKLRIFNNEISFVIYNVLISIFICLWNCTSYPKYTSLEQFLDVPSVPPRCPGSVRKGLSIFKKSLIFVWSGPFLVL